MSEVASFLATTRVTSGVAGLRRHFVPFRYERNGNQGQLEGTGLFPSSVAWFENHNGLFRFLACLGLGPWRPDLASRGIGPLLPFGALPSHHRTTSGIYR